MICSINLNHNEVMGALHYKGKSTLNVSGTLGTAESYQVVRILQVINVAATIPCGYNGHVIPRYAEVVLNKSDYRLCISYITPYRRFDRFPSVDL